MSSFISKFYLGRINVPHKSLKGHRKSKEQDKIAEKNMELLLEQLNEEQKILFLDFIDAKNSVWHDNEKESFALGFRLGAKFSQDTFRVEDDDIEDLFVFEY